MLPGCEKPEVRADPEPAPPAPSVVVAAVSAPPSAAPSVDVKLLSLSGELTSLDRDKALAKLEHFRPLCDDRGYPLVGNLPSKGMSNGLHPSEFCAEVRKKLKP